MLLDEIGEMSPALQAKLLHVLQDGEFSRLGARINSKVDVRIIAATNVTIKEAIAERKFREDLYYRLNTFVIHIPPLRDRREEIPFLLKELSRRLGEAHNIAPLDFSSRLQQAAMDFSWPGNLRELGNFVKRHLIMRDEATALYDLENQMMPRKSSTTAATLSYRPEQKAGDLKSAVRCLKDGAEIRMIGDVLASTNWNRRIAAERLHISYRALLYKIKQYHLVASV